jgi:hypothetical protein
MADGSGGFGWAGKPSAATAASGSSGGRTFGYHGKKRAGVRDDWFRSLDPKRQEMFARTNHQTLIDVYDYVSIDEMREALRQRSRLRAGGQGNRGAYLPTGLPERVGPATTAGDTEC